MSDVYAKGAKSRLIKFFGKKPGQGLVEVKAEIDELTDEEIRDLDEELAKLD